MAKVLSRTLTGKDYIVFVINTNTNTQLRFINKPLSNAEEPRALTKFLKSKHRLR